MLKTLFGILIVVWMTGFRPALRTAHRPLAPDRYADGAVDKLGPSSQSRSLRPKPNIAAQDSDSTKSVYGCDVSFQSVFLGKVATPDIARAS